MALMLLFIHCILRNYLLTVEFYIYLSFFKILQFDARVLLLVTYVTYNTPSYLRKSLKLLKDVLVTVFHITMLLLTVLQLNVDVYAYRQ